MRAEADQGPGGQGRGADAVPALRRARAAQQPGALLAQVWLQRRRVLLQLLRPFPQPHHPPAQHKDEGLRPVRPLRRVHPDPGQLQRRPRHDILAGSPHTPDGKCRRPTDALRAVWPDGCQGARPYAETGAAAAAREARPQRLRRVTVEGGQTAQAQVPERCRFPFPWPECKTEGACVAAAASAASAQRPRCPWSCSPF